MSHSRLQALQRNFDREIDVATASPSIHTIQRAGGFSAHQTANIHPVKVAWEEEADVFEVSEDKHCMAETGLALCSPSPLATQQPTMEHGRLSGDLALARLEEMRAQELALEREVSGRLCRSASSRH